MTLIGWQDAEHFGRKVKPVESVASKLARRIRRMRERKGMNQTELAARVLCSKSHISDIELEHVLPSSAEIRLMEEALDADGVLLELYEQRTQRASNAALAMELACQPSR